MNLDLFNGLFESFGGLMILLSCRQIHRDKMSRGISLWHAFFFLAWGYFNLAFYPSVGAWISFAGSVGVTFANSLWVALMVYYRWIYRG